MVIGSDTSQDRLLQLLVGDREDCLIINAETCEPLGTLLKHKDDGFEWDWAQDGVHLASGNREGLVQIFDSWDWIRSVQLVACELGGARMLKFSPLGSGTRDLAMAEPADYMSVVDAQTFQYQQRFHGWVKLGGSALHLRVQSYLSQIPILISVIFSNSIAL